MKIIKVVAAILQKEDKILIARKKQGKPLAGYFEFPGGKIEEGELPQEALEALIREIKEELDIVIQVGELIDTVEYDYPTFHLSMDCFVAKLVSGNLILKEHTAASWLSKKELDSVKWLPADVAVLDKLREMMK